MSVDRQDFAPVADTAGACPPTETLLALSVGGPSATAFLNVRRTPSDLLAGPGRRLGAIFLHLVSMLPIICVEWYRFCGLLPRSHLRIWHPAGAQSEDLVRE